ncbi:hypothetical protein GCM10009127_21440 [Alteraurantiacibacter aestuarii]|uniref:preprotein translocase subunit YajC n=1 Tax=Alteraurantiacibacter aestuarii TaxID=650004 RepID=UPI0031E2AB5C
MNTATLSRTIACVAAAAAIGALGQAHAQDIPAQETSSSQRAPRTSGVRIDPYIEASQVLLAELSPGDDVLTYTQLAVGVDTGISGRNSNASASLRYERRIGYGNTSDGDTISGIARASMALVPRHLTIEAGGLASRARVEGNGATSLGGYGGNDDATSQIYSLYAGPSVQTNVDDLLVTGSYRIGYTRVEAPDALALAPGDQPVDIFDDSLSQNAGVRAGFEPGTVLPVGVGVGAGWNQQDISNLDQRVQDRFVRADVTVPVSRNVALVGGVGYEDVEVSSRDAVRDTAGDPVIGPDGRFITDKSAPRQIAYETDGLIWDVGVMWRPSRRTSLEAYVGRRYGSSTYYGSFSYAPNSGTSLNIGVYNNLTGFGGALVDSLAGLPTEFQAFRNPITGDLAGCVDALEGGNCALGRLGSLRSSVFRSRGVTASLARSAGRMSYGVAGGYDRRSYIAAAGTALSAANGVLDENIWLAAYAGRQLDRNSSLNANAFVNWFDSGFDSTGNGMGYSASLAYNRDLLSGLSATAAVGLDGVTRDELEDLTTASALVGLRYSF